MTLAHENGGSMTPSVSVIVPVYNVAGYLQQALQSIVGQTQSDIEIIAVNDGSTDDSLSILNEFASGDARIRVVDKPNEGYGSAVNVGLQLSRGAYVSIIEPDDMIDAFMFQDLLAASLLPDGSHADIVKSPYWNFYDYEGESKPFIEPCNLASKMPDETRVFNIHENWEILYHHPSIWSAIYRRDFLEEHGIRMKEIPGAGWADNPWFYETMLQAQTIAWVPCAYYYYRQTNPLASSYYKDIHLPFDRLADLYEIVQRLNIDDKHILTCFYHRTFSYVKSAIERFDYPEGDADVFSLIVEALKRIDPKVLYSAETGIRQEHIDYYEHAMGIRAKRISSHRACESPVASIIVTLGDTRPFLWDFLESCAAQSDGDFEVLCIDCGSHDASKTIVRSYAEKDKRFVLLDESFSNGFDGQRLASSQASGQIVYRANPCFRLPSNFVRKLRTALDEDGSAVLFYFCDGKEAPAPADSRDSLEHARFDALESARADLCNCAYRKDYLLQHLDTAHGIPGSYVNALSHAMQIHALGRLDLEPITYTWSRGALAYTSKKDGPSCEEVQMVRDVGHAINELGNEYDYLNRAFKGFAAKVSCNAIDSIPGRDSLESCLSDVRALCDEFDVFNVSRAHSQNALYINELRSIVDQDALAVLERRDSSLRDEIKKANLRYERAKGSTSYKLGNKIVNVGKRITGRR